ncbi:hypothetical protein GCM10027037_06500 [Mucilaginibacter koreensis]
MASLLTESQIEGKNVYWYTQMNSQKNYTLQWGPARNWVLFALITVFMLWLAHALAFFPHEYAHAITAWLLGWKSNPLALNYGHVSISNLLAQFDIDENVDYAPIFASGRHYQAGIIALAGLFFGNFLFTYPLSLWGYRYAKQQGSYTWALFFYWLCVASVGNLIDYVPVRTFAYTGDMHTLITGFNCSPWWVMLLLGIPFLLILIHLLFSFAPQALHWLFPASAGRRAIMVLLTAFAVFGFYGAAGWSATDPTSHHISVYSVCLLVPLATILGFWVTDRFWLKLKN